MRKDHLHRRSDATADVEENGDPLSGSSDPFDALLNAKSSDASKSNGNGVAPSPVPEDSDNENDAETKNDDDKSETNDDSAGAENDGYEVEAIVGHKIKNKQKYFKIRWLGWSENDDTWQAEDELIELNCPELIEKYLEEHPEANKPIKPEKVRISLPSEPTRAAPKRTAAERKVVVDSDVETPAKVGRGRPKKSAKTAKTAKGTKAAKAKGRPAKAAKKVAVNEEYEVERICGEKIEYGKRFFLVKWKGWPESDNSWEPESSVDCFKLIEKFRDSCRSNKSNKRAPQSSQKSPSKSKKARYEESEDDGDDVEEENEWEVEKIVNVRQTGRKKEYLIRWKGCKASDDTWEPEGGINCTALIKEFLKKHKK